MCERLMGKGEETNKDQAETRIIEQINHSKNKEAKTSIRHENTVKIIR